LISWPESQNINSVSLNSKTASLFPFVLFFTAKAIPPFSAEAGKALRVIHSQLTSIQEALEKQLAVRGLGSSEVSVVRREAGAASRLAGLLWAHPQLHVGPFCQSEGPAADGATPDFYTQRKLQVGRRIAFYRKE